MRPPVLLKRWLPVAGLATLLSGCVPSRQSMPVMLFVAVAVQDESIVELEEHLGRDLDRLFHLAVQPDFNRHIRLVFAAGDEIGRAHV